jgi:hypothetical protein
MMKSATALTAFVLCLLLTAMQALAKDAPEKVLAGLPEKAGVFDADGEVQTYQEIGLGASRVYRVPGGTWITLYLYDLDIPEIGAGIEDKTIKDACQQSMADIREMERQGHYADVKMAEESEVMLKLPTSGKELTLYSVAYSLTFVRKDAEENLKVFSQLFVTGLRNHIFKIRVSRPEGSPTVSAEETESALKTLMEAVAAAPTASPKKAAN